MSVKVLCVSRRDLFKRRGGDTIQIEQTMKYLKKIYGINYQIVDLPNEKDFMNYDIVHIFGIVRIDEAFKYVKICKKFNKKIVLSPVYWNFDEYNKKGRYGLIKYLYKFLDENTIENMKGIIRNIKDGKININDSLNIYQRRQYVLNNSDIILPNSYIEMEKMIEEFRLSKDINYKVVPNAIDRSFIETKISDTKIKDIRLKLFGRNIPYIINVARFDPRKNHINLIKAVKQIDVPLVLVGNKIDTQKYYFHLIEKLIRDTPNIKIVSYKSQEELMQYYQAASLHVLPSWAETPGLVNLEAAASGCKLVVSDRGSEKEYFGNLATYCNPEDVDSIANAILTELRTPRDQKVLIDLIRENYQWENAAAKTYEAYKCVLNSTKL